MENVIIYLENLIQKLDLNAVFLFSCLSLTTLFLLNLFFSIFVRGYGLTKRTWFLFALGGIFFLEKSLAQILNAPSYYADLTLAFGFILSTITAAIRTRKKKEVKESKQLNRFISQAVKCAREQENLSPSQEFFSQNIKPEDDQLYTKIPPQKDYGVDFAHVKSVIDKLEYYGLTSCDKKQVKELSQAIFEAENYGFSPLVKSKINDGLGALLKIMSKHGV